MKLFISAKTIASILFILCTLGLLFTIAFIGYTNQKMLFQTLTPHKDSFTDLYFQNNENIVTKPAVITDFTAVPYRFSFSIHDLEKKPMTYSYTVSLSGFEDKKIDAKKISMTNDQTATIAETFILPNKIPTRTRVTVTLVNKNQQIFFWIGGNK